MKALCTALSLALYAAFPARSAAVPLAWTVDTARGASYRTFDQWAGAEYALEATVTSAGKPLEIDGDVALYYQTNGMGRLYWRRPAEASNNVIRAAWLPSYEAGAAVYSGFLGAPGRVWNAAFRLRLRPSPGASPNTIALPVQRLDFAAVEVENAPWATRGDLADGLAAKADAATVYTKAQADARYYPADEGALWSSWWSGDGFRVAVSNYDVNASSAAWDRLPAASFEYRPGGTGDLVRVWSETARWDRHRAEAAAFSNAVDTALAGKAGLDWGRTTPTGFDAPEGFTWLDTPAVAVAGGLAWQRTVTGEGAVWLLCSNGMVADLGGATNGSFRVVDMATGEAAFEVVQGDRRTVGADCGGVFAWTAEDGKTHLRVVYNVVSDDPPTLHVAAELKPQGGTVWHDEGAEGCPAQFAGWTGSSGAWTNALWRASAPAAGETDALFCCATYEAGGGTVVRSNAPVSMSKIVLGGVTYTLGTATIDGKTVLTLTQGGN